MELGRDNICGMEYGDYNNEVNKMEKEGASSTGRDVKISPLINTVTEAVTVHISVSFVATVLRA